MNKAFIQASLAILLLVVWYAKSPTRAWEVATRARPKSRQADIPYISKTSWYKRPPRRLKRYKSTCEEIAQSATSLKKLRSGYNALKRSSKHIGRSADVAYLAENISKNRNSNRFIFDITRSCQDIPPFYVNANDVETALQSYMVTQGPLDTTVTDFWKAVLHKKSPVIVTLVMAIEDANHKCASYWTTSDIEIDGWIVTLQDEKLIAESKLIPTHRIIERTFTAQNDLETRTIKQVHYENWPDGKIPELELFIKLLDHVDSLTNDPRAPITVHCSAGIGRSGTFVAAHSLRKEIRASNTMRNKLEINIPKAIYLLRLQRMGLVGSPRQYQTVYQTIAREYQPRRSPCFIF